MKSKNKPGLWRKVLVAGGIIGGEMWAGTVATFKSSLVKFINSNYPIMVTKW